MLADRLIRTENANHSIEMFETQIVDETLHDHVGGASTVSYQQLELVVPEDGRIAVDGIDGHLSS